MLHDDPPTIQDEAVRVHVEFWKTRIARRLHAHHPQRPAWDRRAFLQGLFRRAPALSPAAAVELADRLEQAITASRGNASRFRQETADL